jgi:hypothetical protein
LKPIPLHPRPTASGRIDQVLYAIRNCFGTELGSANALVFDEETKTLVILREDASSVSLSLTIVPEDSVDSIA